MARRSNYYPEIEEPKVVLPAQVSRENWEFLTSIEKRARSLEPMGHRTGFKKLDEALDGLQPGFHMLAAESNVGKSSFTAQMLWNLLKLNDNVAVLDFSLDDPYIDRLARIGASATRKPINLFRRPKKYANNAEYMAERKKFIDKILLDYVKHRRLFAYDTTRQGTDVRQIEQTIQNVKAAIEEYADRNDIKPYDLVVFIDSFHDLEAVSLVGHQATSIQRYDALAQEMSNIAQRYDIAIVTTGELRKLNALRRPNESDVRDTVKIRYEAKSLLLGYSDVAARKEAAKIYFERDDVPGKQPVFELEIAKNKSNSVKTRLFFYYFTDLSYFEDVEDDVAQEFMTAIYGRS